MHAIDSLRRLVMVVGVVVTISLLLNASRTYLVSTQINKLQKENVELRETVAGRRHFGWLRGIECGSRETESLCYYNKNATNYWKKGLPHGTQHP